MTETTEQLSTAPAAPRFVDEERRREVVPLLHPFEFEGRIWSEITVRRPTAAMVRDWTRRVLAAKEAGVDTSDIPAPVFDAPDAVVNFVDPDDDDRLEEVARRFLPRRFLADPES